MTILLERLSYLLYKISSDYVFKALQSVTIKL